MSNEGNFFNKFDNDLIRKYKISYILQEDINFPDAIFGDKQRPRLPVKYLHIANKNNQSFPESAINLIAEDIQNYIRAGQNVELMRIYNFHKSKFRHLNQKDIKAIYYNLAIRYNVDKSIIEHVINEFSREISQGMIDLNRATIITIESLYKRWEDEYIAAGEIEKYKLEEILEQQIELEKIENENKISKTIIVSNPNILSTTVLSKPIRKIGVIAEENDTIILEDDAVEVFEGAIPSRDVPFIQWNDKDGKEHYKIYTGEKDFDKNYTDIIQLFKKKNKLYIVLWLGDSNDRRTSSKYSHCTYSFDKGELEIPYPAIIDETNGKVIIKRRLETALSTISIEEGKEISVTSTFIVTHPVNKIGFINETALYNAILTVPIFYNYLYIDESDSPLASRKAIYINYKSLEDTDSDEKSPSSVTIGFNPSEDEKNKDHNTLLVNCESKSITVLNEFLTIFECLLFEYNKLKESLINEMEAILPNSTGIRASRQFIQKEEKTDQQEQKPIISFDNVTTDLRETKIKNLIKKAPEIFTNYARTGGQCPKQPILIKADEVEDWRKVGFYKNGIYHETRQVVPFPPIRENPNDPNDFKVVPIFMVSNNDPRVKYWVVSPDNKNPYIQLNKSSEDSEYYSKYPYVPVCGGTNKLETADGKPNEKYYYYTFYRDQQDPNKINQKTSRGKNNQPIASLMAAAYNESAKISPQLRNLLQTYIGIEVNDKENFESRGMGYSPSSLLHCACIATRNDRNNQLSYNYEISHNKREEYINTILRPWIANNIHPSVYKQELYDLTEDEIKQKVADPKEFFDPYTMYRGVEEAFNINIYVFTPQDSIVKIKTGETREKPVLEIPRAKLFHIRPYRPDRKSIIIYKHKGNESDHRYYQHCALIFFKELNKLQDYNSVKEETIEQKISNNLNSNELASLPPAAMNISPSQASTTIIGSSSTDLYLFDERVTRNLYNSLYDTSKLYVWSFSDDQKISISGDDIVARDNPYSKILWSKIFPNAFSQRIDGYGKTRALNVKLANGSNMTVCIPPTQPMLLPTENTVYYIPQSFALKVFSKTQPSGYHRNGIWFQVLDFKWGIFVPTSDNNFNLPENGFVPPPPIFLDKSVKSFNISSNPIFEIQRVRRLAYVLVSLIIWCRRSRSLLEPNDLKLWWNYFVISDDKAIETPGDTVVSRYLPQLKSSQECIKYLNRKWTLYFHKEGIIHLHPNLHQHLLQYMVNLERKMEGVVVQPARRINNLYVFDTDFTHRPESIILISSEHYAAWRRHQKENSASKLVVIKEINDASALIKEPFLFQDTKTNKIYIVQNVKSRRIEESAGSAFNVAITWKERGQNLGYYASPLKVHDYQHRPHIIYAISVTFSLAFLNINPPKEAGIDPNNYLTFIRYDKGNGNYAALLPLL